MPDKEEKEARRLARLDASLKPLVRGEKLRIGVRMENDEGCLYRQPGENGRLRKATKKQVSGEEPADVVELTRAQLSMLSNKHRFCKPSIQCLSDVQEATPSDEEEEAADRHVDKLRRDEFKRDRHERRRG